MTMQKPDALSFASFPVTTLGHGQVVIDQATAFLYRSKQSGRLHLITNWHVVTGRCPDQPKGSRTGATPEVLRCLLHARQPPDDKGREYVRLSKLAVVDIGLNTTDGNEPAWTEHPQYRQRLDVIALDVEDTFSRDRHVFNAVNGGKRFVERFVGSVTDDVFVIGYPLGLSGSESDRGAMPIYKRGSIASEPMLDYDGRPCVLIDCRTFSGMSGSPVVVAHSGIWMPEGNMTDDSVIGTVENLLGVYSGRLSVPARAVSEGVSDIGVVWKLRGIDEIVDQGVPGTSLDEIISDG